MPWYIALPAAVVLVTVSALFGSLSVVMWAAGRLFRGR